MYIFPHLSQIFIFFILVPPVFFRANARFIVTRILIYSATKNAIAGLRPAGHTYLKSHVSQSENGVSFKDSLIFCLANIYCEVQIVS